eukprot:TRINITY_DN5246_c0_g1_i11.p1 TRINITY_DN5246_c0_g1~~TRINITY_DN5246_c0_g1_i11.p1  ORF type:complete len:572 (-),score=167.61 TRINITY_DN5246_c0_g1_i11:328-2043(-)
MYSMKPVFDLDVRVDLPTCMYSMPVIQMSKSLGVTPQALTSTNAEDIPEAALKALEARQEAILSKLGQLRSEVERFLKGQGITAISPAPKHDTLQAFKPDVVVRCSPGKPVFALPGLITLLSEHIKVYSSVHCHSSVANLPSHLNNFLPTPTVERGDAHLKITLIWKEVGKESELMVSPVSQTFIRGEVNIIRYFARLYPALLEYDVDPSVSAIDTMLDSVTSLLWAQPKDRQPILRPLAVNLGRMEFLCGNKFGIADLALFSALKQLSLDKDLQPELRKWYTQVSVKLMGGKGRRQGRASSSRKSFGNRRKFSERKNSERVSERKNSERQNNSNANDNRKSPKKEIKQEKSGKQNSPKPENNNKSNQQKSGKADNNKQDKNKKKSSPAPSSASSGKENSPPKSVTITSHMGKQELFSFFSDNGINYDNIDHPEVFTVDAMMPYLTNIKGAIGKNLFLKDKKTKALYLLTANHDREVKLNDVAKAVGAKELRFADTELMYEKLGVREGCVTPFALVNDKANDVTLLVDKLLVSGDVETVSFHPLVNTATTTISSKDFNKFLYLTRHKVIQF